MESKVICVSLDSDIYERLEKYCKRYHIKKSRVIESLILKYLFK